MKFLIQILFILVIFFKTGNLLSDNYLFNVNNILLEKKDNKSINQLADQAIKEAFDQLLKRIILKEDIKNLSNLNLTEVKELVSFYNVSKIPKGERNKINFSITFDKDKMHQLLFKKRVAYSDIKDKEIYILPILIKENEIFIFSNNFFYENWNKSNKDELIEFILPLENIEIIQNIFKSRENLFNLDLNELLNEYTNKNIAIVLIQNMNNSETKVYLKSRIQNKVISKNINIKTNNSNDLVSKNKVIFGIKDELKNLIKSQNLIDIRTPSFLNVKIILNKKNNLLLFNSKIKKMDFVENIFIQEFGKNYVNLKIKYLGKLEKMKRQLKDEGINLEFKNDQWIMKFL